MSVESDLKKDGIIITNKLDTLKINSIARNVAVKICDTFPQFCLNQNELFIKLSRLNMYKANMPDGMAEANYFYKNSSIYFNEFISSSVNPVELEIIDISILFFNRFLAISFLLSILP